MQNMIHILNKSEMYLPCIHTVSYALSLYTIYYLPSANCSTEAVVVLRATVI